MSEWRDRLERGLTHGDAVRYLAVDATSAAGAARDAHGLGPEAARLCAELVVAGVLMSAWIKGEERITVQLQASLPRASAMVEVDAEGHVRARVSPVDLAWRGDRLDGILVAINADARQERYRGTTEIRGQTLEQALSAHLATSNQVHAALRVGVAQDRDGTVARAVGVLVERLPFEAGHPSIDAEAFVATYGPRMQADAIDLHEETLTGELAGIRLRPLLERPVTWRCRCSRERVAATLVALGADELRAMRDEDGQAEVVCHFCNRIERFTADDLTELIARTQASPVA